MPVVGHAVAGLTLAICAEGGRRASHPTTFGRWALTLVTLAYLPDVVAQVGITAGFRSTPVIGHSVLFAATVAVMFAPFIARLLATPVLHGFSLTLLSLLLHDIMDIAQSPGRMPLWPLETRVDVGSWIPVTFTGEILTCVPFLIVALAWKWRRGGWRLPPRTDWISLTAVGIVVCAVTSVSALRDRRERDLRQARDLAESGQYHAALEACATADRWPSPAAPGRVDYVRAMSWWGLGRTDWAEDLYLSSYKADPNYIWTIADLAMLYASSDAPLEERRRKTDYWLLVLRDRFPDHPAVVHQIARVQRRLERAR